MKPTIQGSRIPALLLWGAVLCAVAGPTAQSASLDIRLVAADNSGSRSDPRLADLLPLLGDNLKFSSFSLLGRQTVALAPTGAVGLGKGYSLALSDVQGSSVSVEVTHRRQRLLKTRLRFQPGKPVLVGGFPDDGKTLIVVITMREQ